MTKHFIRRILAWTLMIAPSLSLAAVAAAQYTTGSSSSTASTTPGVPNTGAGGDLLANLLFLGIAGVAILAGAAYLAYQRAQHSSR